MTLTPFLMTALLTISGCWSEEEVAVLRVVPGVVSLPGVSQVAVGEFSGPGGAEAGHLVSQALIEQGQYDVLDWSVPFVQGRQRDGWAAAHNGQWGSADATLTGTLCETELLPMYEWRTALTAEGTEVTTYARQMTLRVRGFLRIIDPQNGRILSVSEVRGQCSAPVEFVTLAGPPLEDGDLLDQAFSPPPSAALQSLALQALAHEVAELVAVDLEQVTVKLWHNRQDPELTAALSEAKQGHWQRALAAYAAGTLEAAEQGETYAAWAHYNYGMALALSGDLAAGERELEVAQAIKKQPLIAQGLMACRAWAAQAARHNLEKPTF